MDHCWKLVNFIDLGNRAREAKACKGAGWKWSLGVTFHAPGSVGECEGMNPHTPKWGPTLKIGLPMDFQIF